jgi:hypothetical protein
LLSKKQSIAGPIIFWILRVGRSIALGHIRKGHFKFFYDRFPASASLIAFCLKDGQMTSQSKRARGRSPHPAQHFNIQTQTLHFNIFNIFNTSSTFPVIHHIFPTPNSARHCPAIPAMVMGEIRTAETIQEQRRQQCAQA